MELITCCIAAIGLHVGSMHLDPTEHLKSLKINDNNVGAYVEFKNNVVVGAYHNTLRKDSVYVGYVKHFKKIDSLEPSIVVGGVTGYPGYNIAPLVLASVSYKMEDNFYLRVSYIPKIPMTEAHVFHLSIEKKF